MGVFRTNRAVRTDFAPLTFGKIKHYDIEETNPFDISRLNSDKLFFPIEIFRGPNRVSDSVSDADSHDNKILV